MGTTLTFDDVPEELQERVDYLRETLDNEENSILQRHLEKRLSLLTGGVAIINVGAETEVELKEKQDRVDDAVQAVKAAKKEGILPGGGCALNFIAANHSFTAGSAGYLAGWDILCESLRAPFNRILGNAGLNPR